MGAACDTCPNTVHGATVDANGCPPVIVADFDRDFDRDGDVDMVDFARLQRCYSGSGKPADPNCLQ